MNVVLGIAINGTALHSESGSVAVTPKATPILNVQSAGLDLGLAHNQSVETSSNLVAGDLKFILMPT